MSVTELSTVLSNVSKETGLEFKSMEDLIKIRNDARAEKNWEVADEIRISLDNAGIVLKDSKEGTAWELK